ncbi:MAG: hypothetical protein PHQ54_05510, partial [Candidatus Omnitrophica bacterium]|nr:hypothetical protein [Candidatus Omnitrophota bacterium]
MRKFKVYSIVLIVIAGIILSLSNIFQGLERAVLGKYLYRQEHSADNIVAISVDENNFTQNHLWPWEDNWANYLASFILDLKPSKLILDPDFIKNVPDSESLSGIFKSDKVIVPYRDDLKDLNIDFNSHIVYENNKGIFYTFSWYKNMPSVALLLSGQKQDIDGKSRKIYFMPGRVSDIVPASSIALFGVLRKEGYRDRNVARLKDSIVFLGVDGKGFKETLAFLSAYIAGDVFSMLDRWFSIYLALFLFSVLYIVMKPLKLKQIVFIFLLAVFGWFVFHKFYFNISRNYIELGPVITFSILALSIVMMEKKYDYEIEKKEKREAQLARILKEKEVLPHSTLSSDGASVSVTRYKTDHVGGDFYQFLEFSKGELGVILGWVPGAGLDRVRYIMDIVHSWRDFASIYKEPNKVIQVLNNSLFKYAEK